MPNDLIDAQISAEVAALTPVVSTPVDPLGYGSDLLCVDDLAEDMAEIDGTTADGARAILGQDLYHRLITARGTLPDDRDYGLGIHQYLNAPTDISDLHALAGRIRLELEKDDRVDDIAATVNFDGGSLSVRVQVTPADPALGTFDLILAAEDGEVLLVEIRSGR